LDYLVIDTPPGTSDEHISLIESLRALPETYSGVAAILVTTPQAVSVGDVLREATFCKKIGIPILGVIENMSGFVCPHCSECTNIFSSGGGTILAETSKVPFLGKIPIDPALADAMDNPSINALPDYVFRTCSSPGGETLSIAVESVFAALKR
jgi:Mrp family chromosome partitioning ATPase